MFYSVIDTRTFTDVKLAQLVTILHTDFYTRTKAEVGSSSHLKVEINLHLNKAICFIHLIKICSYCTGLPKSGFWLFYSKRCIFHHTAFLPQFQLLLNSILYLPRSFNDSCQLTILK